MLVQGTSPWARAIQRRYGTPYSHCAFSIGDWSYECGVGGVVSVRMVCYPFRYDLFGIDGVDDYSTAQIHVWCRNTMRCTYDYAAVARFFVSLARAVALGHGVERVPALYYSAGYVAAGMHYLGHGLRQDAESLRPDLLEKEARFYMIEKGVRD